MIILHRGQYYHLHRGLYDIHTHLAISDGTPEERVLTISKMVMVRLSLRKSRSCKDCDTMMLCLTERCSGFVIAQPLHMVYTRRNCELRYDVIIATLSLSMGVLDYSSFEVGEPVLSENRV